MHLTIRDWTPNKTNLYVMPLSEVDVAGFPVRRSCPVCGTGDRAEAALEAGMADWSSVVTLVQCQECTHVYYQNPPSSEFIDNYYRTAWNKGSGQTLDNEVVVGNRVHKKIADLLKELGIEDRGTRILDVGCGLGHMMAGLQNAGFENIYGSELQAYRLASAGKRFPGHIFESDLSVDREDHYDVVYSNHMMEHIYDPREMFAWKARQLAPNGIIIISVPDAKFEPPFMQLLGISHLHSYTVKSLSRLGASFGFKSRFWRRGRADELCAVFYRRGEDISGAGDDKFFRDDELDLPSCERQVDRLRTAWQPEPGRSTVTFHVPLAPYTDSKSNPADTSHTPMQGISAFTYRLVCRSHNWLAAHGAQPLANLGWHATRFLSAPGRRVRGFCYVVVHSDQKGSAVPRVSWPDMVGFIAK